MNLLETRKEVLKNYDGVFEMIGTMVVGENIQKIKIRFRSCKDFEFYNTSLDENGFESDDSTFTGFICKLETPASNVVSRPGYRKGTDFKRDIIEVIGANCYIATSSYFFINTSNFLTGKDYKQQFIEFVSNLQRRCQVRTQTRIQPFCRVNIFTMGFYSGKELFPRKIIDSNKALFLYRNHLRLIWKSDGVSFNKAAK